MLYNVLIVERNRLYLEKMATVIQSLEGFELAARFQEPLEALGQGKVFKPNLILLDIDMDEAISLVKEFTEAFPKASIVCTGERWQGDSASHFVKAGARGYLIKPFTAKEFKAAIESFSKSGMESSSQVFTFFSPKGKSGKTTLVASLALALARRTGEQVGIIDADLQFCDMALFFNLEPASTIVEAVRDINFLSPISLATYFCEVEPNVRVLCGTRNPSLIDRVDIPSFEALIKMSRSLFRYVLVDVPAGFCPTSVSAAEMADTTYLMTMLSGTYELQHLSRAREMFRDWEDLEDRLKILITRVSPCNEEERRKIAGELGCPVEAIIPNEYKLVSEAANAGRIAVDVRGDNPFAIAVGKLADVISGRQNWEAS